MQQQKEVQSPNNAGDGSNVTTPVSPVPVAGATITTNAVVVNVPAAAPVPVPAAPSSTVTTTTTTSTTRNRKKKSPTTANVPVTVAMAQPVPVTTPPVAAAAAPVPVAPSALERLDNLIKGPADITPTKPAAASAPATASSSTNKTNLSIKEESEQAQARLKGLDADATNPGPVATSTMKQPTAKKDINTFINNQLKFPANGNAIPPDQMKNNVLKAKAEEKYRKGSVEKDKKALVVQIPSDSEISDSKNMSSDDKTHLLKAHNGYSSSKLSTSSSEKSLPSPGVALPSPVVPVPAATPQVETSFTSGKAVTRKVSTTNIKKRPNKPEAQVVMVTQVQSADSVQQNGATNKAKTANNDNISPWLVQAPGSVDVSSVTNVPTVTTNAKPVPKPRVLPQKQTQAQQKPKTTTRRVITTEL